MHYSDYAMHSADSLVTTSTATRTDMPGPGRLLDKYVFQRAGRVLEGTLGRMAHRAGYGPNALAQRIVSAIQNDRYRVEVLSTRPASFVYCALITDRRLAEKIKGDCLKLANYAR